MPFRISKGIDVFLTRNKYETTLRNHSQHTRWLRAQVCYCLDPMTKQADLNCPDCRGRGRIYSHQKTLRIDGEEVRHSSTVVEVANSPITAVHAVERTVQNKRYKYDIVSYANNRITIATSSEIHSLPQHYETLEASYDYSLVTQHLVTASYLGNGVIELDIPYVTTQTGQRIYADITRVISVYNETYSLDITERAKESARRYVYFDMTDATGELDIGNVLTVRVEVIKPFAFALIGVSEKMMYEDAYAVMGGQCYAVVPYTCYVGVGDLITQAAGESRGEEVLTYLTAEPYYTLSAWDVGQILSIKDATGTEYREGIHYVLEMRNRLRWVHATVHPTDGAKMSVSYMYNPTFIAIPDKPLVRAGENQNFPRRVNLTVYDKVNPMYDANIVNKW